MELREKIAAIIVDAYERVSSDEAAAAILAIPEIKTALELQEGARSASGHAR